MQTSAKLFNIFIDRRVLVKKAVAMLSANNIKVDEREAGIILDFLYQIAATYGKRALITTRNNPKRKSNQEKLL